MSTLVELGRSLGGADRAFPPTGRRRRDYGRNAATAWSQRIVAGPENTGPASGAGNTMIELGIIDDSPPGTSGPFFEWLHAMDTQRFDISVAGVSPSVQHAVTRSALHRPDVWLLRSEALDTAILRELCGEPARPEVPWPVVVVCDHNIDEISGVLAQRVAAITLSNDSPWHVTSAIHAAAARQLFLSPHVLDRYRDQVVELITSPVERRLEVLTSREHDVLMCLAEGMTNSQIAGKLYISKATVGSHVLSILRKLNASNRTEAAALAYQFRLMDHRDTPAGDGVSLRGAVGRTRRETGNGVELVTGRTGSPATD